MACSDFYLTILYHIFPDTNNSMTISKFAVVFKQDCKFIVRKIHLHSLSYNLTCYKYNTCKSKVYRFDFQWPILL